MAGNFTAIDLSQIAAPAVVEIVDFETILSEMVADLQLRAPEFSAMVESDPVFKVLEVAAYREVIMRQRVNEAAQAVMLPYARGADLENLAALFGVVRLQVSPGDPDAVPPVAPVMESDPELRRRVQLSLEGYSTAGPRGAYIYHALTAHGDVLDASAISPAPGDVLVTVLSRTGGGIPSINVLNAVSAALNAEDVRPLCDTVTVQAAEIVSYEITAEIEFRPGPDADKVLETAQAAASAYAAAQHVLGDDVTLSGIYAALHQPGVARVNLITPAADIPISEEQASRCIAINVTVAE